MVDLEDLVRSSIQRHAERSPGTDGLFDAVRQRASRQRRTRRRGATAAAAVIVTGVIAATSAVLTDTGQTAPAGTISTSQPPAPAPTTGPAPTTLPWQGPVKTVSYHGREFSVPADWPLNSRQCAPPQPGTGTVILPASRPVMMCGTELPPGLTTIYVGDENNGAYQLAELGDTKEQDLDGHTVLRGQGPHVWSLGPAPLSAVPDLTVRRCQGPDVSSLETSPLLAVPDLGVVVVVESPDPILAEGILDMVRIVDVDSNGCQSKLEDAPAPVAQAQEPQLQPVDAADVSVCRYHYGWLARSATLNQQDRASLVDVLAGLRPGTASVDPAEVALGLSCEHTDGAALRILLTPQGGDPQVLSVDPDGCQDLSVTGAQGTFAPTRQLYGLLSDLVDSHVGNPPVP